VKLTAPLIDVDRERRRLEQEETSISRQIAQSQSSLRRAIHSLNSEIKAENSALEALEKQEAELVEIIEGRFVPSAVDLPSHEADDIRTKLRLRIKGVKGLAIEKAREDIVGVRQNIDRSKQRIRVLEERKKLLERHLEVLNSHQEALTSLLKKSRALLREVSSILDSIQSTVRVFGWFDPYVLLRKGLQELSLSRSRLSSLALSRKKRMDEISAVEREIERAKEEIRSALGEAYQDAFMPIVFKNGRSPLGERYLRNELTHLDIESLDLESKIRSSKSLGRKADRLSSVLWDRRGFLERMLQAIAHLCELRMYKLQILRHTESLIERVEKVVSSKSETCGMILALPDSIARLNSLSSQYLDLAEQLVSSSSAVRDAVEEIRSDL